MSVPNCSRSVPSSLSPLFLLVGLVALLPSASPAQLLGPDRGALLEGADVSGSHGSAVAAGDFDGDGWDDLAVGSPLDGVAAQGQVRVWRGGPDGLVLEAALEAQIPLGPCIAGPGSRFGSVLATADLDGDGDDELVVGVPDHDLEDPDGSVALGAGEVVVFDRTDIWWEATCFHQDLAGMPTPVDDGNRFGAALAAGDFDADGRDDLAIGTPGETIGGDDDAGGVTVLYGTDDGSLLDLVRAEHFHQDLPDVPGVAEPGDRFGSSLVAGDFLAGSHVLCDLAVGSPGEDLVAQSDRGAVHVLFGCWGAEGLEAEGTALLRGDGPSARPGQEFGSALATGDLAVAGDIGVGLFVGAPGQRYEAGSGVVYDEAGAVYAFFGTIVDSHASVEWDAAELFGGEDGLEPGMRAGESLAAGRTGGRTTQLLVGAPGSLGSPGCTLFCERTRGAVAAIGSLDEGWDPAVLAGRTVRLDLDRPGSPGPSDRDDHLGRALAFGRFTGGQRAVIGVPGWDDADDAPSGAVWLVSTDALLVDGFETGDTSAWSPER